jgi:prepilin-type N-terminal cleavage/methylation domain-containing protein
VTPARHERRHDRESGVTLIELVVTVVIMGIAFVVIVGGMGTAILGADVQRQRAGADLAIRTAAETVAYQECAASYSPPASAGFSVTVTRVTYWDAVTNSFVASLPTCAENPPTDGGLQLVDLAVTSTTGRQTSETLQVVKRRP